MMNHIRTSVSVEPAFPSWGSALTAPIMPNMAPGLRQPRQGMIGGDEHLDGRPIAILQPDIIRVLGAAGDRGMRMRDIIALCSDGRDCKNASRATIDLIATGRARILNQPEGVTLPNSQDYIVLVQAEPKPEPRAATPEAPATGKKGRAR